MISHLFCLSLSTCKARMQPVYRYLKKTTRAEMLRHFRVRLSRRAVGSPVLSGLLWKRNHNRLDAAHFRIRESLSLTQNMDAIARWLEDLNQTTAAENRSYLHVVFHVSERHFHGFSEVYALCFRYLRGAHIDWVLESDHSETANSVSEAAQSAGVFPAASVAQAQRLLLNFVGYQYQLLERGNAIQALSSLSEAEKSSTVFFVYTNFESLPTVPFAEFPPGVRGIYLNPALWSRTDIEGLRTRLTS